MYSYLYKTLGKRWANILTACWYLLLLVLIYYFSPTGDGRFKYLQW